jgi:lipopolysaccharide transport system permease protein
VIDEVAFVDRARERSTLAGLLTGVLRYRELIRNLVLRDIQLKYRGSILGLAWSLMNPIVLVGASTLAFKYILRVGPARYPFFALVGVLAWTFFTASANMSTRSMIDGAGLLKSVKFPRAVLPIATVLFNLAQYLLAVAVYLPVMFIAYRTTPPASILAFPLMLALQVAFTIGLAMLLSVLTVSFRDIRHLVEVSLSVLFWTTPVLYPLQQANETLRPWLLLSPLSPFVVGYHQAIFEGRWPEPTIWLLAVLYTALSLLIGGAVFARREDALGEQL